MWLYLIAGNSVTEPTVKHSVDVKGDSIACCARRSFGTDVARKDISSNACYGNLTFAIVPASFPGNRLIVSYTSG